MQLVLTASKIAKFIATVAEDDNVKAIAEKVSDALAQNAGKDHISLTSEPIANGTRIRLVLEEGILKSAAEMGQQLSKGPGM